MDVLSTFLMVLPVFCLVLWTSGVFVCYAIGLSLEHYPPTPYWPYVSDVGTQPPESCLFTLILVWVGIGLSFSIVLYYKYVQSLNVHVKKNRAGLVFGQIAFVGGTIVASFQWTELLIPHMIGAVMVFAGLAMYAWVVAVISLNGEREETSKFLAAGRVALAVFITLANFLFVIFLCIWQDTESVLFRLTTSFEWLALFLELLLISTLAVELRKVTSIKLSITTTHQGRPRNSEENGTSML